MRTKTVAVIGAGVGGIVAAIHLARRGMRVTVVEKNADAGGRCDRLSREGHQFDAGPTLLVMPLLYETEFQLLGSSLYDVLDLQRVDPTYHLVFEDGSRLALTSDMKVMQSQLEAMEPGSFQGFLDYMVEGYRHYHVGVQRMVHRDFRRAGDFFNLKNLPLLSQLKPLVNHYRHMAHFFGSPRLKTAFTFQDVYMGLSPFKAAATFSLMPYSELAHGVWYPRGGMIRVVDALMDLAHKAGVEFLLNTTVEKIEIVNESAHGLHLEQGGYLPADIVLANADLPYVYRDLLPPDGMLGRLSRSQYSCSAISFFWGVNKRIDPLEPHMLFLADDYRANFDSIMRDCSLPANPSLYLHAPSRLDPSMAPAGQDTLVAIVPVGHMHPQKPQDWERLRDVARGHVFRRLAAFGIRDLEAHIKFEISYTPLAWQKRFNLVRGATHGLSHNLAQLGYLRPHNRHARYHNLYFAGASTHPGTGLPTAMVSGRLAAMRILDETA